MRQLVLDIQPSGPPTLDDFVVGRNAEVLAALRQWTKGMGERFIYLWGEPGAGKTHLLNAVGTEAQLGSQLGSPSLEKPLDNHHHRRRLQNHHHKSHRRRHTHQDSRH